MLALKPKFRDFSVSRLVAGGRMFVAGNACKVCPCLPPRVLLTLPAPLEVLALLASLTLSNFLYLSRTFSNFLMLSRTFSDFL